MREQRVLHRDEMVAERPAWSPSQIVAGLIGLFFLVMGAVALARGGLTFPGPHTEAFAFHHTPLLGALELAYGLLMLAAAGLPGGARGFMGCIGVLALGFGIVVIASPLTFHNALGAHAGNGWYLTIAGAIVLVAAAVSPTYLRGGFSEVDVRGEAHTHLH